MSTSWFTFRARWQGLEYTCSPELMSDGLWVHLISQRPVDGFEEVQPGTHVRLVAAVECDMVAHVTMACQWRGEPCLVQDERDDALLLEYIGGRVPRALELGLERIERGVYRGWVPRAEVQGLRENTTLLVSPNN